MKAVGYYRVSTDDQRNNGVSLDVQREKYVQWCKLHGHDSIGEFSDEGISGGSIRKRPAFQQALAVACKEKAVLVVYNLSRFTRKVRDALNTFARLEECGAQWCSIMDSCDTTTPMGRAMVTILLTLNELERENVRVRTSDAMKSAQAMGKLVTSEKHIPYGYRLVSGTPGNKDGRIGECEDEQETIKTIIELRDDGMSYHGIAKYLTQLGIKPRGKKWYRRSIKLIYERNKKE